MIRAFKDLVLVVFLKLCLKLAPLSTVVWQQKHTRTTHNSTIKHCGVATETHRNHTHTIPPLSTVVWQQKHTGTTHTQFHH